MARWCRAVLPALLSLVAACAGPAPYPASPATPVPPTMAGGNVVAVLASGNETVFDNAADYLRDALVSGGVPVQQIRRVSARAHTGAGANPDTATALLEKLGQLAPPSGGGCFVFVGSHGVPGIGLSLDDADPPVTPALLDQALTAGCDGRPTVVVVSACYAGQFAKPPMTRPNRIVLTAAQADRTSFGCAADSVYTYFDDCLLGALPGAATWQAAFERVRGCVAIRERLVGAQPSDPQAFFGAQVAELPTPWASEDNARKLVFDPAPNPYAPSLVPFGQAQRAYLWDELTRYADARPPKALAVTPAGFTVSVLQDRGSDRTDADVARLALQRCEWLTGGACILFARDNRMTRLLPSGLAPLHPPLLARDGTVTTANVPFIRDDQRPEIEKYLAAPGPKALALSPGKTEISIGTGPTPAAAREQAMARCRTSRPDCVIFAEGTQITLGWGN